MKTEKTDGKMNQKGLNWVLPLVQKREKTSEMVKKGISISFWCIQHPKAGQNTQHRCSQNLGV